MVTPEELVPNIEDKITFWVKKLVWDALSTKYWRLAHVNAYWEKVDCILVLDAAYVMNILDDSLRYDDLEPSLVKYIGSRLLTSQNVDPKKKFGCYIEVFVSPLVPKQQPDITSLQYAGLFFNAKGRINFRLYPTTCGTSSTMDSETKLGFEPFEDV
jgi:hypothetical protein